MLNIIKNATKFTRRGSIDVKAYYDSQLQILKVQIKDTGVGIAPEDIPKLFNRFGKLHRTAEMNHEGIGLGLTIVKQIVEKCGGTIGVISEGIGHGCIFFFSMKMRPAVEGDGQGLNELSSEEVI